MKIDLKVFLGLVSHQRNNPVIRANLKKLGIGDALIPDWVAVTAVNNSVGVDAGVGGVDNGVDGAAVVDGVPLQRPKPTGTPLCTVRARKKESTEHSKTQQVQQAQQAEQSTSTPGEPILDARAPGWVAAEVESPVESRGSVDGVLQKPNLAGAPARLGRARKKGSTGLNWTGPNRVNRPSQVDPSTQVLNSAS